MKAAVFVGTGRPLEVQQLPDPEPGLGEVTLRVERCGICATDLHVTGAPEPLFPPGMILGHEVGGEVIAVGHGVDWLKPGDAVIPMTSRGCDKCAHCLAGRQYFCAQMRPNFGGYAEFMLSSAASCVRIPAGLSLQDAALVEPLSVALHGITLAPVRPGDRVLVMGAGPIGLGAVFWAERLGAQRIAVMATSHRREPLAEEMGATSFTVVKTGYETEIVQHLGGPPDVVVECVGALGVIAKAIDFVKPRGVIIAIGLCMHMDSFAPATALLKEIRLQFAIGTSRKQFEAAASVLACGAVAPRAMVTDTITLGALPAQFEALRGRTPHCKVLVAP
jgi:(R,R)-butanediol dehydrogenase/meso-butanediol dehydrogenase/diacetyl reductase